MRQYASDTTATPVFVLKSLAPRDRNAENPNGAPGRRCHVTQAQNTRRQVTEPESKKLRTGEREVPRPLLWVVCRDT